MKKLNGLYLVISPIIPREDLVRATEKALDGGVDLVQYSAGKESTDPDLVKQLAKLAGERGVPFLVNNDLALAGKVDADGVHFDGFEVIPGEAREALGGRAIVGYTVNIDLGRIGWAQQAGADYVSFCSIFHVCEGGVCPLVSLDTLREVRSMGSLPIFAAGGISLENANLVLATGIDGIVVTSAILKAADPYQAAKSFKEILKRYGKS